MTELTVSREPIPVDNISVVGPTTFADESVADGLMPFKMLFSLEDVKGRLEQVFDLWLEISRRYFEALVHYFGGIYRPAGYTDLRFPQIMNALTLFQSEKRRGKLPSPGDRVVEELTRGVSPANAAKLGALLRSHPMIGAERALVDLLEENRKEFAPLVTDEEGRGEDAFVQYVLNTLSFTLTREKPSERYAATGEELHWLTEVIAFLIKISLLKELEFSREQVSAILNRNPKFRHIADTVRLSAFWLQRPQS
jgi:hypothetical protein